MRRKFKLIDGDMARRNWRNRRERPTESESEPAFSYSYGYILERERDDLQELARSTAYYADVVARFERRLKSRRPVRPETRARNKELLDKYRAYLVEAQQKEWRREVRPRSAGTGQCYAAGKGGIYRKEHLENDGSRSLEVFAVHPDGRVLIRIVVPGADETGLSLAIVCAEDVMRNHGEAPYPEEGLDLME